LLKISANFPKGGKVAKMALIKLQYIGQSILPLPIAEAKLWFDFKNLEFVSLKEELSSETMISVKFMALGFNDRN
jgi:hypothetical protein